MLARTLDTLKSDKRSRFPRLFKKKEQPKQLAERYKKSENRYSSVMDTIKDSINQRLSQEQLFNSKKDIHIARMLLEKLSTRYETSKINQESYLNGLNALNTLIPAWDEKKKKRRIADILISPVMEKTIASRLNAKEVDIMGPEGAWGRLPEEVKLEITRHNHFTVEMTSTCTVKCHFCAFAKKGPIKQKISLNSLKKLIKYSIKHQTVNGNIYKQDAFYSGSDPFDIKWKNHAKGDDLDYSDFMQIYNKLTRGKQRFMFTSTSVPIGEEMRILNAIDQMVKDKQSNKTSKFNSFRISKTHANEKRVNAMQIILTSLYGDNLKRDVNIRISNIIDNNVALAGKGWKKPNLKPSMYDIMGVGCQDDVIIGLDHVDAVLMEASSNERPNGETRFPILKETPARDKVFSIPVPYAKPYKETPLEKMYPDIRMTTVTIPKNGPTATEIITIKDNPHRSFLRIISIIRRIALQNNIPTIQDMTVRQKIKFRKLSTRDIEIVQSYLDLGNDNVSMRVWMKILKNEKFILD